MKTQQMNEFDVVMKGVNLVNDAGNVSGSHFGVDPFQKYPLSVYVAHLSITNAILMRIYFKTGDAFVQLLQRSH